jgi:hypothetical protein
MPASILTIDFHGRAVANVPDEPILRRDREGYVVNVMNQRAASVATAIELEIQRSLPPSVVVEASISFTHGSMDFTGLVTVLDWASRLSGTLALGILLEQSVRVAVRRALAPHLEAFEMNLSDVNATERYRSVPDISESGIGTRRVWTWSLSLSFVNAAILMTLLIFEVLRLLKAI